METAVREKPVLFSAPMVRAILSGRKTQTRRIVKGQPEFGVQRCQYAATGWATTESDGACSCREFTNPYGKPGDRLWVRETWGLHGTEPKDGPDGAHVYFRATDGDRHELRYQLWRPSIFMPRWASRLTLEITDIRVERLQEITEEDARAEGCWKLISGRITDVQGGQYGGRVWPTARRWYQDLWNSINGDKSPWSASPWVWVVSFKRV